MRTRARCLKYCDGDITVQMVNYIVIDLKYEKNEAMITSECERCGKVNTYKISFGHFCYLMRKETGELEGENGKEKRKWYRGLFRKLLDVSRASKMRQWLSPGW